MYYTVTVNVELANGIEFDDLHYDDMQELSTWRGEHEFVIRADNDDDAREGALDDFHCTVPIRMLEDFNIETIITGRFDSFQDTGRSWRFSITGRGR